jgi:hypothetical protein
MLEEVPADTTSCRADFEWFMQHYEEIYADPRYKNGYVAIQDGQIVDFDHDGIVLDARTRNPDTEEAQGVIVEVTATAKEDVENILKEL